MYLLDLLTAMLIVQLINYFIKSLCFSWGDNNWPVHAVGLDKG